MKHLILITAMLYFNIGWAQENKILSFTLNEAIEEALTNNYKLINAKQDIASAKAKKWEATASGLPQINANLQYLNNLNFQEQGVTGNAFNPNGDPDEITTVVFGTKHTMIANATVNQLLFDGSYIVGLQSAKVFLQISENAYSKSTKDVIEMVNNAYSNALLAEENTKVLENNKKNLEKLLFDTKEVFKNGLIEEENVEQLEINLSQVNAALSNSQKQQKIALNLLKIILGISIEENIILKDQLLDIASSKIDFEIVSRDFNVNENIDYQMSLNNQESKRLLLKLEKFRALPTVGAQLNFGYNSFANEFSFLQQNQPWYNFSNLGVNLSIPVFSSFRDKARKDQAKIALEQATNDLKDAEQRLHLQFQQAVSEYEFSMEEFSSSKNNLILAEKIEKKQQIKFKEGISSSFEYTEAQRQLYTAQQNYLRAMTNLISKKSAIDKLIN